MSVRDPVALSRANGVRSVGDPISRGWRSMRKKRQKWLIEQKRARYPCRGGGGDRWPTVGSEGGAFSYERGTPVEVEGETAEARVGLGGEDAHQEEPRQPADRKCFIDNLLVRINFTI